MSSLAADRRHFRRRFIERQIESVRKRYLRLRYRRGSFVSEYFGAKFHTNLVDAVSRNIALKNFERSQLKFLLSLCKIEKADLLLDVGANIGLYTCVLLNAGAAAKAVAFEPDRRTTGTLRDNVALNGLGSKVQIVEAAASARNGEAFLELSSLTNTGSTRLWPSGTERVTTVAVDDVVSETGNFIIVKMDIENHELEALKGMSKLLLSNYGIAQIETSRPEEVASFMAAHGFRLIKRFASDFVFSKLN